LYDLLGRQPGRSGLQLQHPSTGVHLDRPTKPTLASLTNSVGQPNKSYLGIQLPQLQPTAHCGTICLPSQKLRRLSIFQLGGTTRCFPFKTPQQNKFRRIPTRKHSTTQQIASENSQKHRLRRPTSDFTHYLSSSGCDNIIIRLSTF
jgi:hypothetical protein